jgi:sugar phosphate isomerase/epimerase
MASAFRRQTLPQNKRVKLFAQMKELNRREALATLSLASSALICGQSSALGATDSPRTRMGIVTYAFGIHQRNNWQGRHAGLSPAMALLEESHRLGAAGIQIDLGPKEADRATELRHRLEQYGMYLEASITPPASASDADRFEKDVLLAKQAGASLARTVLFPGRRYEQFKSLAEFRDYEQRALQSLRWAEPVLTRHNFRLAVENHKDQRIHEKVALMKSLNSEFVGLCVDVGNNFTLIEDPLATVRGLAPWAFTVHFKDQAVRESEDGFWYADAALGRGILDLSAMVKILDESKPGIHFNLEMITRDPLSVPVLKDDFWVTMPDTPARELASTFRTLKTRSSKEPFATISTLPPETQMAGELENVTQSLSYAREQLKLI